MSDLLFIRLKDESVYLKAWQPDAESDAGEQLAERFRATPVEWILYHRQGDSGVQQSTLAEMIDQVIETRGDFFDLKSILLMSGVRVVSAQVAIPAKQTRQIMQALPFMLEDQLAEDVELFHRIIRPRTKDGQVPVLLCKDSELQCLADGFESAGLPLDVVLPDMYCVPCQDGEWHFVTDGRQLLIRQSEHEALSVELDAIPVLMGSLLANTATPPQAIKVSLVTDFTSANLENWMKTQITSYVADQPIEVEIEHLDSPALVTLTDSVRQTVEKSPFNLLQGKFKPLSRQRPSLFNWKPIAALLVLAVGLHIGYQHVQINQLNQETAKLDQDSAALYKRYFPNDRSTSNLKRRIQGRLASQSQGGSAGFLVLLTHVGEEFNALNTGAEPKINPTRISFDEKQGDIRIDMLAGSFNDLDQLKSRLAAKQLDMEIASAANEGDKVRARVNIKGASS